MHNLHRTRSQLGISYIYTDNLLFQAMHTFPPSLLHLSPYSYGGLYLYSYNDSMNISAPDEDRNP